MEIEDQIKDNLINEDLAPIPQQKRKWGTWNYAALWIRRWTWFDSYGVDKNI